MFRAILAIVSTAAGLIILLSFKTHGTSATTAPPAAISGTSGASGGASAPGSDAPGTAIPELDKEALAAGGARIDTISGATYTSEGYVASLQNALDQAGI